MSPWLEYREMRDWQMWSQKILLSLSSASSSSLLGGLLSFVKLTSIGLLGLQCINIWGATDNPGVLMDQLSGWRLQAGNILRPRPGPTFVLFVVFFFFYLRIAELQLLLEAFLEQNIWFIHSLCFCGHTGTIFSFEAVRRKFCCSDW